MKSIVKKVRFIFENRTLKGELCSTKTVSFFKFMDMDRIDDNFVFPFDYELYFTNEFSQDNLDSNATNVFVVPMNNQYIQKVNFETLYSLQDKYSNVILFADYSNETLLPGNFKTPINKEINFQTDRFICAILSVDIGKEIDEPKFKKVFPSWIYATGVIHEIEIRRNENNLHKLPVFTWPGKQTHKKFFFPNRLGRNHRLDLIVEAHQKGLLKQCEWTFMVPNTEGYLNTYEPDHEYWKLFGKLPRGISQNKHEVDWCDDTSHLNRGGPNETLPMSVLERTMAVIVSDTYNDDDPVLDCSEKILKPLIYGMPTFYNGRKNVLKKFKELGFWFPGDEYNSLDINRPSAMIDNCLNFEDVITKETTEHVKQNKKLAFDRHTHYKLSEDLFNYILDF